MASLVIKNLPDELHALLKKSSKKHHRSMTQEAIAILMANLAPDQDLFLPPPVETSVPMTMEQTLEYIRQGRDNTR